MCRQSACVAATAPGACSSGATRPCGNEAVGACRKGTQRCVGDAWETTCTGEVTPAAETCNGLDDDCDGTTDEGVTATWYVDTDGDGHGAATDPGLAACAAPPGSVASNDDCDDSLGAGAAIHPGATELCDAQDTDEDCDGVANEGCSCTTPGSTQPCCAGRGTQSCEAVDGGGVALSACSVSATVEVCNGIDDDCDGQTDEGVALSNPDGGALALDGGVAAADGTCAVGIGACARTGATAGAAGSRRREEGPVWPAARPGDRAGSEARQGVVRRSRRCGCTAE